jgi:hypothetical protein
MVTNTVENLLIDLADDNPPPRGLDWFTRETFDPPHGLTEIKYAKQRGWVDLDEAPDGDMRFRLTMQGVEASVSWPESGVSPASSIMLKARDLVRDLIVEGIEEKWTTRDDFDPPHRLAEIRKAARLLLIEIKDQGDALKMSMRITARGREHLALKSLDQRTEPFAP